MSCLGPRTPKLRLLVGLLVAGVTPPIGVPSLSDEGFTRTAGSGKINPSCACALSSDILHLRLREIIYDLTC